MIELDVYVCYHRWVPGPYDVEPEYWHIDHYALNFADLANWMAENKKTSLNYWKMAQIKVRLEINGKGELALIHDAK